MIFIFLIVPLAYMYYTWQNHHWTKLKVPHIKPKFFIGNIPNGLVQEQNFYYTLQKVFKSNPEMNLRIKELDISGNSGAKTIGNPLS